MPRDPFKRICGVCRREIGVAVAMGGCDRRACIVKLIDAEIAAGRHNPHPKQFCGQCRQWVDSIYYVTLGAVRLCPACADACDQGPKADERRMQKNNASPAMQGRAGQAGKDAKPQGSGGSMDGNQAAATRSANVLPPLSDEERRRRFPTPALATVNWEDE